MMELSELMHSEYYCTVQYLAYSELAQSVFACTCHYREVSFLDPIGRHGI